MPDGGYQRRFGDRRDGRLLRSLPPARAFAPYLAPGRGGALDLYSDAADAGAAETWIRGARGAGWDGIGFLHIFIAAYLRTVAKRPGLNRFVAGQKIYARSGVEVVLSFRREPDRDALVKLRFDPADTVYDVYRRLNEKVDAINAGEDPGRAESLAETFMNFPGPLLKLVLWFLNVLDYFGLLPRSLAEASPVHGSVRIDDLGSTGAPPLYRWPGPRGDLPLTFTLGSSRSAAELDPAGRRYVDYRAVMDARAADAAYRAEAMKLLKYYLEHPEELEFPPDAVAEDIM